MIKEEDICEEEEDDEAEEDEALGASLDQMDQAAKKSRKKKRLRVRIGGSQASLAAGYTPLEDAPESSKRSLNRSKSREESSQDQATPRRRRLGDSDQNLVIYGMSLGKYLRSGPVDSSTVLENPKNLSIPHSWKYPVPNPHPWK